MSNSISLSSSLPLLGLSTNPIVISESIDAELPPNIKKINLSPLFKPLQVFAEFDINSVDPIKYVPYSTLIQEKEKEHLPYVLAIVKAKERGENEYHCVDGDRTWEWVNKKGTNPITAANNLKKIFYFTIYHCDDKEFTYLCHSKDSQDMIGILQSYLGPEIDSTKAQPIVINEKEDKIYDDLELPKRQTTAQEDFEEAEKVDRVISTKRIQYHQNGGKEPDLSKDRKTVFELYKSAADKGHAQAQYRVGCCYRESVGVKRDLNLSMYYLFLAVEQNVRHAAETLGTVQQESQRNFDDEKSDEEKSVSQHNSEDASDSPNFKANVIRYNNDRFFARAMGDYVQPPLNEKDEKGVDRYHSEDSGNSQNSDVDSNSDSHVGSVMSDKKNPLKRKREEDEESSSSSQKTMDYDDNSIISNNFPKSKKPKPEPEKKE